MRNWRKQNKLQRMEEWEKKCRTTVLCPTFFFLEFSRVLVATLLLRVTIFFPCLASLLSLSYINSPHKPMRLPLLLHFSKMFPCPELFFLPVFLNFFIPFVSLPCAPFLSLFSISVSTTGSFLPPSLLDFSALFCHHPSSCSFSPRPHILLEIPLVSSLTGYLTLLQNQPLPTPPPIPKLVYHFRQSNWTALSLKMGRKRTTETTVLELQLTLCNIPEDCTTVLASLFADTCFSYKDVS